MTPERLAEEFALSGEELSRYIEEQTGATLEDMVKRSRLKKARVMLKETDQAVGEIAASVGYETQQELSRLFQEVYGTTPEEFRRSK